MIETEEQYSEYVDIKTACSILGVSRASLDNYAKAGRLNRFQQGAPMRTRYSRSELNRLKRIKPKYQ